MDQSKEQETETPAADAAGSPMPAWEQIEDGRYMPRRVRGSCHGRELG